MAALKPPGTQRIMLLVLAALTPGALVLIGFYGYGYLPRLLFAVSLGLTMEAAALRLRGRPAAAGLRDGSTAVTCVLLVLAMPPELPYGVLTLAVVSAIGLGKHLYGGLGNNPFNPAIVGYAVVLLSFPGAMDRWPQPADGLTGATALTAFRYREGMTVADVWQPELGFGTLGGYGWEWINAAFLAGGAMLLALRLASWRVPVAMLVTLGGLAALNYDAGSSSSLGSPLFHWFTGGTMLAAFFFATDPVTHPASARGQMVFGCVVGAMAFLVRGLGNYPDGIAFGILLANALTPFLDRRWAGVRHG